MGRKSGLEGCCDVATGRSQVVKVKVEEGRIQVSGHANTAPIGADIVCAAVSALTLTLLEGMRNVAGMKLYESVEPGNICIEWQEMNDTGRALVDTWLLGMRGIAAEYPVIEFL